MKIVHVLSEYDLKGMMDLWMKDNQSIDYGDKVSSPGTASTFKEFIELIERIDSRDIYWVEGWMGSDCERVCLLLNKPTSSDGLKKYKTLTLISYLESFPSKKVINSYAHTINMFTLERDSRVLDHIKSLSSKILMEEYIRTLDTEFTDMRET